MEKKYRYLIGIDPGVKTGLAVWDTNKKIFDRIETTDILNAIKIVFSYSCAFETLVMIENPNLRNWFGNSGREKLQGAGSIKRDYSIWEKFLNDNQIEYQPVPPKNIKTKLRSDHFRQITGYVGKTSNHSRDAAMMVYMG